MYPLSLQELGSDNTAYVFRSIVERNKELSKLQCFWDFNILLHKFKEKTIFLSRTPLLRTLAITDTKPFSRGCPQKRESTVLVAANQINAKNQEHN